MYSPSGGFSFDIETLSGICGSISIACWVVVFSPQIIENFRRSSAEGLSIEFVIIWLAGDVFNILGAVLQGVLPTMIILAIYYTFADIVLLGQCFYYRGFTLRDPRPDRTPLADDDEAIIAQSPTERTALINHAATDGASQRPPNAADIETGGRNRSRSSFRERLASLDATHLSPATPMHPQVIVTGGNDIHVLKPQQPRSLLQAIMFNSTAVILVVLAGVVGFYLSPAASTPEHRSHHAALSRQEASLQFSVWGQVFGYICAVLYLGSRIPQLLLNYRRKSTEGLNVLFFLFACIGNLTYVLSIFAFAPLCHAWHKDQTAKCRPGEAEAIYGRYILVNLSWLLGSLGTLFLDGAVFAQFWMYHGNQPNLAPDALPRNGDGEGRGRALEE